MIMWLYSKGLLTQRQAVGVILFTFILSTGGFAVSSNPLFLVLTLVYGTLAILLLEWMRNQVSRS